MDAMGVWSGDERKEGKRGAGSRQVRVNTRCVGMVMHGGGFPSHMAGGTTPWADRWHGGQREEGHMGGTCMACSHAGDKTRM